MKHIIYCTVNFLEGLYKYINRPISEWIEDGNNELTIQLYNFIHSPNAIVYTNESLVVKSKTNPNFKKLFKSGKKTEHRSADFDLLISDTSQFFTNITHPSPVFLIDNLESCKEIGHYGALAYTHENINSSSFLFSQSVEHLTKGRIGNWEFIKKYRHPFNSLILADAHILTSKESKENLIGLLLNLLPSKLSIPFDLTIITDRDVKTNKPTNKELEENEILNALSSLPYTINLTIIIDKIHDRNFITNYLWCNSGYGFELVKNGKINRNTHLTFYPITYNDKNTATNIMFFQPALLHEYKNTIVGTPEKMGLLTNVVGNRNNRLLH